MALSNLNKRTLTDLLEMINIKNHYSDKLIESIKNDYLTFSKLKMISSQITILQNEANEAINSHQFNQEISDIECLFKKTPGTFYYLYQKKTKKYLSLIPPDKWWGDPGSFISRIYYDYDLCFYKA